MNSHNDVETLITMSIWGVPDLTTKVYEISQNNQREKKTPTHFSHQCVKHGECR